MSRSTIVLAFSLPVLLLAGACGSQGATELQVVNAWARPTPQGASNGVVYFEIQSPIADRLTSISVPPAVAAAAELHESSAVGGHGGHSHGGALPIDDSVVTMTPLESVDLPAGKKVVFESGGRHVMLTGLSQPLEAGTTFTITLRLAGQGTIAAPVVVRESPP